MFFFLLSSLLVVNHVSFKGEENHIKKKNTTTAYLSDHDRHEQMNICPLRRSEGEHEGCCMYEEKKRGAALPINRINILYFVFCARCLRCSFFPSKLDKWWRSLFGGAIFFKGVDEVVVTGIAWSVFPLDSALALLVPKTCLSLTLFLLFHHHSSLTPPPPLTANHHEQRRRIRLPLQRYA